MGGVGCEEFGVRGLGWGGEGWGVRGLEGGSWRELEGVGGSWRELEGVGGSWRELEGWRLEGGGRVGGHVGKRNEAGLAERGSKVQKRGVPEKVEPKRGWNLRALGTQLESRSHVLSC